VKDIARALHPTGLSAVPAELLDGYDQQLLVRWLKREG
jgi:hypothetical protein